MMKQSFNPAHSDPLCEIDVKHDISLIALLRFLNYDSF